MPEINCLYCQGAQPTGCPLCQGRGTLQVDQSDLSARPAPAPTADVEATCTWCDAPHQRGRRFCRACGHRAQVSRDRCTCRRCATPAVGRPGRN